MRRLKFGPESAASLVPISAGERSDSTKMSTPRTVAGPTSARRFSPSTQRGCGFTLVARGRLAAVGTLVGPRPRFSMTASVNPVVLTAASTSPPCWRTTSCGSAFPSSSVARTASSTWSARTSSPMWRSIMVAERTRAVGLMTFFPAYFGAEPWTASKIATSSP